MKIIYEDKDLLVVDKPAGIIVFPEGKKSSEKTLIDYLLKEFPNLKDVGQAPRHGIIHRLDKDTSGILLVAKNNKSLEFFQEQFKKSKIVKKYLALVAGNVIEEQGKIETLIGRDSKDRKKQRVYLFFEPNSKRKGLREAVTEYKVLKRFPEQTLLEVIPKTGRKHQIRVHLLHLGHPIIGDKIYNFKDQSILKGLTRQFLHAHYLKFKAISSKTKELRSEIPKDLQKVLENNKIYYVHKN